MEIKLVFNTNSLYADANENIAFDIEEFYEGESVEKCLTEVFNTIDEWNHIEVINFKAQSEIFEVNKELKNIYKIENGAEIEITERYRDFINKL